MNIKGKNEVWNFMEGNDDPEYGTLWEHIDEDEEPSKHTYTMVTVVSKHVESGKFYQGTYLRCYNNGAFPDGTWELDLYEVKPVEITTTIWE